VKRALSAIGIAAAILAGCSSGDDAMTALCPGGGIVPDLNLLVRFREGPGRDVTDVVVQGKVADIRIDCDYPKGRNAKPGVAVDLQVAIAAERGPADRTRKASLPYFVAIVDRDRNIAQKFYFNAEFEWKDNRPVVGRTDRHELNIPLRSNFDGPSYQIFVGFQLDEAELDWNRKQRGAQ
jgi:hypothetical protein